MAKRLKVFIGLASLLLVATAALLIWKNSDQRQDHINLIRVDTPHPNQMIQSPLFISGQARGMWYFEATFPVEILDDRGNVLARGAAQAQGEWMTDQFVPFRAELQFSNPSSKTGTLVLEKSNPSGLVENAASIKIPVHFK
ncbi:Gmad2 immunoglobulin-like domain-containing protein [Candidatus Acetothermia bacterium]|nr:Gmad2 immunoglobulin-like domain-containing protein [Candidatus Acetothermia bacterium]MBI3644258.1 Gmad2 immunoglobulin-like domain-containing protein [Candidatus Acetothermia bacterium]